MRKISPREAMRMMQRMGMKMEEVEGVTQVVIKTSGKQIVIDRPSVTTITVQGQTMYQVAGGRISEEVLALKPEPSISIPEEDVRLVAEQAGKSLEEARKALRETGGDLAKAILLLRERR